MKQSPRYSCSSSAAPAKRMGKNRCECCHFVKVWEAGGHIGKLTTMTLVRQVAAAVSIPLSLGGIAE